MEKSTEAKYNDRDNRVRLITNRGGTTPLAPHKINVHYPDDHMSYVSPQTTGFLSVQKPETHFTKYVFLAVFVGW